MTEYSYFHSVMTHGLLFWGHLSDSIKIFRLQKKIIRIMMVCKCSGSCRKLLFNIEILPLPSQYILSLLLCMIRNSNQFVISSEINHFDTRQHANFHQPSMNTTKCQKVGTVQGLRCLICFLLVLQWSLIIPKKFTLILQKCLYANSFYSSHEYFELQQNEFYLYMI